MQIGRYLISRSRASEHKENKNYYEIKNTESNCSHLSALKIIIINDMKKKNDCEPNVSNI